MRRVDAIDEDTRLIDTLMADVPESTAAYALGGGAGAALVDAGVSVGSHVILEGFAGAAVDRDEITHGIICYPGGLK